MKKKHNGHCHHGFPLGVSHLNSWSQDNPNQVAPHKKKCLGNLCGFFVGGVRGANLDVIVKTLEDFFVWIFVDDDFLVVRENGHNPMHPSCFLRFV